MTPYIKEVLERFDKLSAPKGHEKMSFNELVDAAKVIQRDFIQEALTTQDEALREEFAEKPSCPPHTLIDYHFQGAWGGSVPPPNKMCSKCLLTLST